MEKKELKQKSISRDKNQKKNQAIQGCHSNKSEFTELNLYYYYYFAQTHLHQ